MVVFGTPLLFTITYLMAASEGHHPTTITSTGIYPPESYIFRFGAFPLMTFMGLLFYFFKEWLEELARNKSHPAQISFYLALLACICMNVALAVMQGKEETLMTIHTVFAILFFVLMLVSQILYTYEDNKWRKIESKTALGIRLGTNLLQFGLLTSALVGGILGSKFNAIYEWLITFTYFLWYSSFLFERDTVFTRNYQRSTR
jgi:preprotein translocase subunit SecG